ncbi:MAG TPA: DUF2007 domain-containing protein [Gemmatimonadales bacterium]|nr:DUF2007 domain-containing protein [Gemmatimonadales bacterium]
MWSLLTVVGTSLEVDMMKQTLDAEEIPALVRGPYAGVFGGGYQGPVPGGIQILVPEQELERARDLLGLEAADG